MNKNQNGIRFIRRDISGCALRELRSSAILSDRPLPETRNYAVISGVRPVSGSHIAGVLKLCSLSRLRDFIRNRVAQENGSSFGMRHDIQFAM